MCKTGQPMSTSWRHGTKERPFYRTPPSGCFWILRLFPFRIEVRRRAFEEENEFLQKDIKESSNNLVQNQEVRVSSIASVMKTSTSSYFSGKSQEMSNKSSSSGSKE